MAGNPFEVQTINPLQALLVGDQAYQGAQKRGLQQAKDQSAQMAAQQWQAGDKQGALATLLQGNNFDAASAYGTVDQRDYTRGRDSRLDERQLSRDAVSDRQHAESLALQRQNAARLADKTPAGFATNPDGSYRAITGGPADPVYLRSREEASGSSNVSAQVEQRRAAANRAGLTPDNPAYNSYILTGKMPREDAQPLTATDKKAILEADEGVMTAKTAIDALNKAKEISPKAMGFKGASTVASFGSILGNQKSQDTVELDNTVTSNALTQLKSIFGGNPTEGERKIMLDIQGSSSMPDAVRQKIFDRAIGLAQNRLKFNEQRAGEMRGGQFYKPQGSMTRAPVAQSQGISQQQYEALPSGSPFTAPDGTQRIKP